MTEKLIVRVLNVLDDGPAHCHDVADELGINMRTASATLCDLYQSGLIRRVERVRPFERKRDCWVYERPPS